METSKKLQSGWTLKGKIGPNWAHSGNVHYFKNLLKLTYFDKTGLFLFSLGIIMVF